MANQCTAIFMPAGEWHRRQCRRNAVNDGYCKQHHPDAIAAKRKRQDEKWDAEDKASKKHRALVSAATNPDNVIITRVELQLLISLSSWDGIIRANNEKFLGRMATKLKEGIEQ